MIPYEIFMAFRFLRENRAQTWLIFIGVGVGVGVLVFLSALINGLQESLIQQTLSIQAHVVVKQEERSPIIVPEKTGAFIGAKIEKGAERTPRINAWTQVQKTLEQIDEVVASAPTVAGSAFVHRGALSVSVALRGIDTESYSRIVRLNKKIVSGAIALVGSTALIGVELSRDLGLVVGDRIRLETTSGREDILRVGGIFDLGNKDVNQRWVFVSIREAQSLLDLPGAISTFEVRVLRPFEAETVALEIAKHTGLKAEPWTELNQQLLIALKSQSSSSVMIQFFVILAVALGIAGVLVVSVVQKSREIGILRATGTSVRSITIIFLMQGLAVGIVGAGVGISIGVVLALLFAHTAVNPDGSPTFPVDLNGMLFARAAVTAVFVGLFAAVIPARRAAKLDPAEAIRNV